MALGPRLPQHPTNVVSLQGWEPDNDSPFLQGAKPKRLFICPSPPPHPFLIGDHTYLFKEPEGRSSQQIWSEVIAYELSRDFSQLAVPPAFVARGPGNGTPGVLIEFFYGYTDVPQQRYVNAIELLQRARMDVDFKRGSLKDNITLCRLHSVSGWREWWARTLAFDAIIGNTDRHTENWGFLIQRGAAQMHYSLAPAFDNGTSLGFILREEQLSRYTQAGELHRFIARGRHHFGWIAGDRQGAQHAVLCRLFRDRMRPPADAVDAILSLSNGRIDEIVDWCASFEFEVPFSCARARFVAALLKARREALAEAFRS